MAILRGLWNLLRRFVMHLFQGNSLRAKRKRYVYGQVPTLPHLNVQNNGTGDIPFEQLPSLEWLKKAAMVQLKVLKNQRLNADDGAPLAGQLDEDIQTLDELAGRPIVDRDELLAHLKANVDRISDRLSAAHASMTWPQQKSDYDSMFHPTGIPIPNVATVGRTRTQAMDEFFIPRADNAGHFDDQFFANLRTAGYNPMVLAGIDDVPAEFTAAGFDDDRYRAAAGAGFGDDTLAAAAADHRLYLCDFGVLTNLIETPPDLGGDFPDDTQKYITAPKAWFALPPTATIAEPDTLRPLAIQLQPDGVLFSPNDPDDTGGVAWTQAKYAVDSADGNYHELISHLGQTHLVIEPVVISTERNLRERHEIYRLLSPHLEGTIFINNSAATGLIAAGGQVDEVVASTIERDQLMAVRARGIDAGGLFRFNKRFVPDELAARGVMDQRLIFPYRDDAMRIWNAIHEWVGDYVDHFYGNDAHVAGDVELQNWADELISPEGGQLQEFGEATGPGDKVIATKQYLVDALSLIIFTASAQHAAVNFAQAQIMAYVPAVAGALYGSVPTAIPSTVHTYSPDGTTPGLLTPDSVARVQLDFLSLLGGVYYTRLGQYRHGQFGKAITRRALQTFQNNLVGVQQQIDEANNDSRRRPLIYPYLIPETIPQSINI